MTHIFDHLQISGYRGLRAINLSQLGPVNIFVGDNNSGKTSLLEAVSVLCNPLDPFQWLEVSQRRLYLGKTLIARPDLEAIQWIFQRRANFPDDESYQSKICITSSGSASIRKIEAELGEIYGVNLEKGQARSNDEITTSEDEIDSSELDSNSSGVELNVTACLDQEQGNLFSSDLEHRSEVFQFWEKERFVYRKRNKPLVKNATISPSYSSSEPILDRLSRIILQEEDRKKEVLDLIQPLFDDNIVDFEIASTSSARAAIYVRHKEIGFAPLYVFGDGFKRALVIALTLLTMTDGVLLIDEVETSIHVSALSSIFAWLIQACRYREIQLFVTTHSLEAIDAMLQPGINVDDIVAFRLKPKGQELQRFSGDLLHRLRSERGLDVR